MPKPLLVARELPFLVASRPTSRRPPQAELSLLVRGTWALRPGEPLRRLDDLEQGFLDSDRFADAEERDGEVLQASDFADHKALADVLVRGVCHPPAPTTACEVGVTVGAWSKRVRVVGDRRWERRDGAEVPSPPATFEAMALTWTRAAHDPRENPVGVRTDAERLPNLEDPARPIRARGDARPRTLGPVSPSWPARAELLGKEYGAGWLRTRSPWYAEDFDWAYFQAAPADQRIPTLRGDEAVVLEHLLPGAPRVETALPALRVRAFVKDRTGLVREVTMAIDTLFLALDDPDDARLVLSWRGLLPVGEDDLTDLRVVYVGVEPLESEPLPTATYVARLEAFERDPSGVLAKLAEFPLFDEDAASGGDALSAALGPLERAAPEAAAELRAALAQAPDEQRAKLDEKLRAAAARPASPGPIRTVKPGALPPLGLRRTFRSLLDEVKTLRRLLDEAPERAPAGAAERLRAIDAVVGDPRWKELDPTYEPPFPLSIVEPGPGADLRDRDLTEADLRGRDLRGANLEGAVLTRARLGGANLSAARLDTAILFGADLERAELRGASLGRADLGRANARGATFDSADLSLASLEAADLTGASLRGVVAEFSIWDGATLSGADLSGARLDRSYLEGARLDGARLDGASLCRCVFAEANLTGARLEDALVTKAHFAEAKLERAHLVGLRGESTNLMGAVLAGADLSFAVLPRAFLDEADALGARFHGADLRWARCYRAHLDEALLEHANLFGADLRKAVLRRAVLRGASLYEALLDGADLTDADTTGADMTRARRPEVAT